MSIVGTWNLTVNTPIGTVSSTLIFNADGTGQTSSRLGSSEIMDLKIDGEIATFSVKIEFMGQETLLTGSATADRDSIIGKYVDPEGVVSAFEGHRAS